MFDLFHTVLSLWLNFGSVEYMTYVRVCACMLWFVHTVRAALLRIRVVGDVMEMPGENARTHTRNIHTLTRDYLIPKRPVYTVSTAVVIIQCP
jgi:hypothetical protein